MAFNLTRMADVEVRWNLSAFVIIFDPTKCACAGVGECLCIIESTIEVVTLYYMRLSKHNWYAKHDVQSQSRFSLRKKNLSFLTLPIRFGIHGLHIIFNVPCSCQCWCSCAMNSKNTINWHAYSSLEIILLKLVYIHSRECILLRNQWSLSDIYDEKIKISQIKKMKQFALSSRISNQINDELLIENGLNLLYVILRII